MRTLTRIHSCHAGTAAAVLVLLMSGRAAAQETILYYTTDAIGSVRMVTDSGGAVVARYDYRPFGDPCGTACGPQGSTERRQFAGGEKDAETSLDYFAARYYANGLGRFTTVDPDHFGGDLFDPQSWNAYAYARSNPIRFIDPTGLECTPSGYEATFRICVTAPSPQPVSDWLYKAAGGLLDTLFITTTVSNSDLGRDRFPDRPLEFSEHVGGALAGFVNPKGIAKSAAARIAAKAANVSAKWGRNRIEKELRKQGFVFDRLTRSGGGQLYRNPTTGEEIRIMPKPGERFRSDPAAKHESDYYYRYRSGPDQPWGPHTSIPNR